MPNFLETVKRIRCQCADCPNHEARCNNQARASYDAPTGETHLFCPTCGLDAILHADYKRVRFPEGR